MKIDIIKGAGGVLVPASDMDADSLQKFKTGEQYQIEIKRSRNPAFHRKTFAFFNFCFAHWQSDREFLDERGQFEVFRSNLTVFAGFYNSYYTLAGGTRVEAKSLSFASMGPEEFEAHYKALVAAAMRHLFKGCGVETENQLLSFF